MSHSSKEIFDAGFSLIFSSSSDNDSDSNTNEQENSSEEQMMRTVCSLIYSSSDDDDEPKPKRRYWVRPYYRDREESGAQKNVVETLINLEDFQLFKNYMRMSPTKFEELLQLVAPFITKETVIRIPINPQTRLSITLRHLATGMDFNNLAISYKCSPASVKKIVSETTLAITEVLKDKVFPKLNEETFKSIGNGFNQRWNFPNCMGAIDGKHVTIQAPPLSGSLYFNYKKTFSIVMLAICDHKYRFMTCYVGAPGRQSDGGIFRTCQLGKKFYEGSLPIPENCDVDKYFRDVPYIFVADDAFSLHINMLKPYSKSRLSVEERIFNYRLSRARRVVENSFGILSARWRIFKTIIVAKPEIVEQIILSAVCLYNWLIQNDRSNYMCENLVDRDENGISVPVTWRNDSSNFLPLERHTNAPNSLNAAKQLRNRFATYFVGSGAVEWQNNI